MSTPFFFKNPPAALRDLVEQHGYALAVVDTVVDPDTVRVLQHEVDGCACYDLRIKDLDKHELNDPDLVKRQLALAELNEIEQLLPIFRLGAVKLSRTRTFRDQQSFARKIGSMVFWDGTQLRDVAQTLQPIRRERMLRALSAHTS